MRNDPYLMQRWQLETHCLKQTLLSWSRQLYDRVAVSCSSAHEISVGVRLSPIAVACDAPSLIMRSRSVQETTTYIAIFNSLPKNACTSAYPASRPAVSDSTPLAVPSTVK